MEQKELPIVNVTFPEGTEEKKAEVTLLVGNAAEPLAVKPPRQYHIIGNIDAVSCYLGKREINPDECIVLVDRDKMTVTFIENMYDEYKKNVIEGCLQYDKKYLEFGINSDKVWTPQDLAMHIKMNRNCFADQKQNRELVYTLMNYKADIQAKVDKSRDEKGNYTESFAQVVNSNLPTSFTLHLPIIKGQPNEDIEVETFAKVDGSHVYFMLLSPGAASALDEQRDDIIDAEIDSIAKLEDNLVIIEK